MDRTGEHSPRRIDERDLKTFGLSRLFTRNSLLRGNCERAFGKIARAREARPRIISFNAFLYVFAHLFIKNDYNWGLTSKFSLMAA